MTNKILFHLFQRMEKTTTQKGKDMLLYEGYRYKFAKCNADWSISWRCLQANCRGRVKVLNENITVVSQHNHAPDPEKIQTIKAVVKMRENATLEFGRPRQIIRSATEGISMDAVALLPSYNACQRVIERKRKLVLETYVTPRTVADIVIPLHQQLTNRGSPFLLWDSGALDPHRILMFGTYDNLDALRVNSHWFIDGTFKVAPELYMQVFTIHGLIQNKALPMVYVLLTNKTEDSYFRLFDTLKTLQPALNPQSVMSDFEKASQNAVQRVFPTTESVGCLFHLGKCLWRKVQQLNHEEEYKNDENFRIHVKMLLSLSFVPPVNVIAVFDELALNCPPTMNDLIAYWEDTYIGRLRLNVRVNPRFPIQTWNVYSRVTEGLPRTNNSVEGWHRAFQQCVDCHHPSIYKIVEHFRKEQDHVEIQLQRIRDGVQWPTSSKSKYVQLNRRLESILPMYGMIANMDYLRRIAHNLSM
ncbi:uncharacterized protein LOC131935505 [Physella acuta]|uniref:uncharacterized protein LOC131935505 n=1 Tax=Physella acuta TaxID=109671 RepID=UPI0027DE0171|nr:uncharacterized protein LOC131935505 [Physella acuta]